MKELKQNLRMKISIVYKIVFISLFVVSCMPQGKYIPPTFELLDEFRVAEVKAKQQEVIFSGDSMVYKIDSANLAWNHYFKDPTLVNLIQKGLENNFDVRQAFKRVEIARLSFSQSKMEFLPSVSGTIANPNYQWRSEDFYSNPASNWYNESGESAPNTMYMYTAQNITGLNFKWEIDIWGNIRSKRAEELNDYLATNEGKNAVQTRLVTNISSGYYNLLMLYAQLEVAESNFALSERTLKMVELQFNSGNTTALAKQQTRAQMLVAKALIPRLKQQISQQENEIQFLTGALPNEITVDRAMFDNVFNSIERNYVIPMEMVSYRPDVRKAEYDLLSANAAVGVAQTNQYPKLVIDLGFGVNSMLPRNWFNIPGALFGSVIGNLTQPIFSKRRLKTKFEQTKIEREIREISLQKEVYGAVNEISNVLTTMNALDEQISIAKEQVENSNLTIKQANLLFNSGYATYLEVINAQRVALESELKLNQLKEDRLQMKIKLYQALGGGW